MANFPSVTAGGAFESPAVRDAIKRLAEQAVADRLAALEYDSDVIDVSESLTNGWSGPAYLSRLAHEVTLHLEGVTAGAASSVILVIPKGWQPRPAGTGARYRGLLHTSEAVVRRTAIAANGALTVYGSSQGEAIYGTLKWTSIDTPSMG